MKANYWTQKDSEIIAQLEQYGIEVSPDEYNRKDAITKLKEMDMKAVSGELNETKDYIAELKEKQPELILRKVIFHSTSEQDIPYVFVGHNGSSFYLPKEIEIDVPEYILKSCIKDAVEDRLYPFVHTNGDIEWRSRKVQRFPFSYAD
jgi:hypothetical protein